MVGFFEVISARPNQLNEQEVSLTGVIFHVCYSTSLSHCERGKIEYSGAFTAIVSAGIFGSNMMWNIKWLDDMNRGVLTTVYHFRTQRKPDTERSMRALTTNNQNGCSRLMAVYLANAMLWRLTSAAAITWRVSMSTTLNSTTLFECHDTHLICDEQVATKCRLYAWIRTPHTHTPCKNS